MFWHLEPHTGCPASPRAATSAGARLTKTTRLTLFLSLSLPLSVWLSVTFDTRNGRTRVASPVVVRQRFFVSSSRVSRSTFLFFVHVSLQLPPTVPSFLPLPPRNRERSIDEVSRCFSPRTREHMFTPRRRVAASIGFPHRVSEIMFERSATNVRNGKYRGVARLRRMAI